MFSVIAIVALASGVRPEVRADPPPPIGSFIRISEDEGLAHSDVRAITQDHVGYMWFGLRLGGLTRYDGYELKVYRHDPADPQAIGNPIIWSLLVDRGGTLWVGTEGGLDRYDREADGFVHHRHDPNRADSIPNDIVTCIYEDSAGRLWVGTRGGLCRLDDRQRGTFTTFRRSRVLAGSSSTNTIRSIVEDPATGLLWLGTSDGLAVFDPRSEAFATFLNDPSDPHSLSSNPVNKVVCDERGVLWALTERGLNSCRPTFAHIDANPPQPLKIAFHRHVPGDDEHSADNFVRDGLVDGHGRFWLATRSGLYLLDRDTGRFTAYRHKRGDPTSLGDNFAHALFEDRSGTLWVGTYAGGVSRMRSGDKPFRTHRHDPADPNSLSEDRIAGLTFDTKGRLWASTSNGLNCFDGQRWTRYHHDPTDPASLPNDDLAGVAAAPDGSLWIGSSYAGLSRFDGERFQRFPITPGPAPNGVYPFTGVQVNALLADAAGGVWIGARAYGLDYYKEGSFRHFLPQSGDAGEPPQPVTNAVFGFVAANGDLWFITELNGLVCLEAATGRFTAFLPPTERPGSTRSLHCLADSGDGRIWVGAADALLEFDARNGRFVRQFTTRDGLPHAAVMTIVSDRRGRLWLGTANGLAELDPATARIRSYERADGLPTNVFAQRSGVVAPDGRVFLGTRAGIVEFDPEQIRDNPVPPPVVLTELQWIGRPPQDANGVRSESVTNLSGTLQVPPGQLGFRLKFSALDYAAPEKNRFRFRLEGWDETWRSTTARDRIATYTSLPPGTYVFRVQASNSDQVWSPTGAAMRIVVAPRFWQTLWFRVSAGLALVGFLGTGLHWRLRGVRQRNAELERQVSLRTAQLQAEVSVREQAQAALRESHAQLENRVEARTLELARANATLQAEIAERHHVEAQLRQAQKMEAIGQLAGGIAHDFNNLLTVILGQSELLGEPDLTPLERDSAIRDIRGAAQRATNLTRQLLVFSRRQPMAPTAVDLNDLVAGVIKLLRHMIGERVEIQTRFGAETLGTTADPGMLEQVLLNLAVNARDAMPRGGRLTIATGRVHIGIEQCEQQPRARPGEYAKISVSDTGCGIPESVLPQIFEPFFTTKESGKGSGLGLAISLGIVLQHQGWIDVETALDRGTTFYIYLPIDGAAPTQSQTEPAVRACPSGEGTVLVAEDEEAVRVLVERVLTRCGYRVVQAASGAEALERWAEHRHEITVLLSDVVMPGRPDGHELASRLVAEKPGLRVVMMSGYDPGETTLESATVRTPLRKPFTADELITAIEAAGKEVAPPR